MTKKKHDFGFRIYFLCQCIIVINQTKILKKNLKIVILFQDLLNNLMVQYMTLLNQFGTLMECAPAEIEDIFSALPFKAGVFFLPPKNTSLWNTIMGNIFECTKALKESFNVISASSQTPAKLLTWAKFSRITADFKRLALLITNTVQAFELQRPGYRSHTCKDLYELLAKVTHESNEVLKYSKSVLRTNVGEVVEHKKDGLIGSIQRLSKEVLLVFQDIIRSSSEKVGEEESSADVCPESLFTVKISQYLTKFVKMLRLEKVLKLMKNMKRIIQHSSKTVDDIRSIDSSIRFVGLLFFIVLALKLIFSCILMCMIFIIINMHKSFLGFFWFN